MTEFLYVLLGLLLLLGLAVVGLLIPPRPFRPHPRPSQPGDLTPLHPDLPEPVRRHFAETLGVNPPKVDTAVVWGRGKVCTRGVWVPVRFKTWYQPGVGFSRRMELTWFQRPILRGRDVYVAGQGTFEVGGRAEHGQRIEHGQLLSLWAEAVLFPSVLVHDPAARWEAVDAHTARLLVPFDGKTEQLNFHFDPDTGRMTHISAERLTSEPGEREPWRMDLQAWKKIDQLLLPCELAFAVGESGSPWAYWSVDGVAYNVPVKDQLQ